MTTNNSVTLTLSGFDGKTISGITLKDMRSNATAAQLSGYAKVSVNGRYLVDETFSGLTWFSTTLSNTATDVVVTPFKEYEVQSNDEIIIELKHTGSSKSLYVLGYEIKYLTFE